jgi:hypothetical protein
MPRNKTCVLLIIFAPPVRFLDSGKVISIWENPFPAFDTTPHVITVKGFSAGFAWRRKNRFCTVKTLVCHASQCLDTASFFTTPGPKQFSPFWLTADCLKLSGLSRRLFALIKPIILEMTRLE